VHLQNLEIRNVTATVRSEGEPSRQDGQSTATLGSLTIRDLEWPSTGGSGRIEVSDFNFEGIAGRWEGNRLLAMQSADIALRITPEALMVEDALIRKPVYRQSWDHLNRDQISRTEDLLNLVFSARDSDFLGSDPDEEEAEKGPGLPTEVAMADTPPEVALDDGAARPAAMESDRDSGTSRRRARPAFEVHRLRIDEGNWIRQTRINGTWTDVVTTFDLDLTRLDGRTSTVVEGRSNYDDSEFAIRYTVAEGEDRTIAIRARRMPFHQMFWGETIHDERIPRVQHVLYSLDVDVTHARGLLLGEGRAGFSEVQVSADRRPFWQRVSLKGGGWATILSELADPETGASKDIPFAVERPLSEFNFFVLYTELQGAFDQARLAMLDPDRAMTDPDRAMTD